MNGTKSARTLFMLDVTIHRVYDDTLHIVIEKQRSTTTATGQGCTVLKDHLCVVVIAAASESVLTYLVHSHIQLSRSNRIS